MPGLLTLAITLPIIGAVLLMLIPNRDGSKDGLIRYAALGISLLAFAVTLLLWAGFDASASARGVPVRRALRRGFRSSASSTTSASTA